MRKRSAARISNARTPSSGRGSKTFSSQPSAKKPRDCIRVEAGLRQSLNDQLPGALDPYSLQLEFTIDAIALGRSNHGAESPSTQFPWFAVMTVKWLRRSA